MTMFPQHAGGFWPVDNRWSELLNFEGLPTRANLDPVLDHLENLMVQRSEDRRAFRAVIECVQNLVRHADPLRPARFSLSGRSIQGQPRFCLRSLNPIRMGDLERVEQWISRLNGLRADADEGEQQVCVDWRSLYRDVLNEGARTPRGGAGLGWISLSRMALKPPCMRTIEVDGVMNLFISVEVACGS